jgi:hypothetical protein
MKRTVAAATLLALFGASSALAEFKVQLKEGPERTIRAENGIQAADSRTPRTLVRVISPGLPFGRRGTVRVLVMNTGTQPFTFGPGNVTLTLADGTVLPEVPLTEFDKGARLIDRELSRGAAVDRQVKAGLADLARATSSGPTASVMAPVATPSTGSAAAAAQSQDRNADINSLPGAKLLTAIYDVMRPTKVAPQEAAGGYLVFDMPKALRRRKTDQELTIDVKVGGDTHRFAAVLDRT